MEFQFFDYTNIPPIYDEVVLCLGFFDGIHLGHREIIAKAKQTGYKVGVLTFDESPAYVLGKIKENHYLTSNSDKAELLESLGVDYLLFMHFDKEVAQLSKDEFIEKVINPLHPIKLFCGTDYRFGLRGEGDPNYLSHFYDVDVTDLYRLENKKVSSRDIVSYIENGNIAKANELLSRPYRINGIVVEGLKNGRKHDFPTANLELNYPYAFPKVGVYMGYAYVFSKKYKCIISIGTHPTIMQLKNPIVEVHLLDFNDNLYGLDIFVEFIDRIRNEIVFANTDELKAQLEKDKEKAKKSLQ